MLEEWLNTAPPYLPPEYRWREDLAVAHSTGLLLYCQAGLAYGQFMTLKSGLRIVCGVCVFLAMGQGARAEQVRVGRASDASAVPPQAVEQFQSVIGDHVETLTILGGDYNAAGGIYSYSGGNLVDISITKLGGSGDVTDPSTLFGDVRWAPVLEGNVGHITTVNKFENGYLRGNKSEYDVWAVQGGGGVRFYLTDHFSIAPTVSGLYGQTENKFDAENSVGDMIKEVADGSYINWTVKTWSVSPSIDVRYGWSLGRTKFQFTSRFNYFHTESFDSTSPFVNVAGDSTTWENKLGVDVPLGLKAFGLELRTGGFISRTDLRGSAESDLHENHMYTANARLVVSPPEPILTLRWIGLGVSYFWADHFSGWSAGIDMSFDF